MAVPGRKPLPTKLHVINGNPSKLDLDERAVKEPKPKPIVPKCPSWLDPIAKKEWKRVVPELEALGLLTCVDGAALEGYCQAYAQWVKAEQVIQKHGTIFKTPSGYIQQLPQVAIAQKYLQICKSFMAEFGLTPSSRGRMQLPSDPEDDDPMEKLLKK